MDSDGRLFKKGAEPAVRAELLVAYEQLCADGFEGLDRFSADELDWLQQIHDRRLGYLKEERRMHFGAFALVGLALVILLPAVLSMTDTDYFIPLASVELLLIVLLVPYTFVYRKYEEGLRRMMREA
ncbi:MAG: hypothetical protein JRF63_03505, partial [Deltaproteobacteria bacterium]|nr:hypothetical protein [Deltaproteobacteria bacterium]